MFRTTIILAAVVLPLTGAIPLLAQQEMQDVETRVIEVRTGIYMLAGRGGNIGLSVGDDGAFLIDDQYAPLTEKIVAAVATVTDKPVRFVVNTHWHGDHTGGNENMGRAGALIVAHENVRKRMSVEQFIRAFDSRVPPAPEVALPVITFTDALTFHWNGDEIRVFHVENAHTDGDAIIHFTDANVIHAGDTFFNNIYPFIDAGTGGTLDGVIQSVEQILSMANPETKIIPGHGELTDDAGLRKYRDMLVAVRDRMQSLIAQGKSKDEIVAAKPTQDFDAAWGNGIFNPDQWVGVVYDAMTTNGSP